MSSGLDDVSVQFSHNRMMRFDSPCIVELINVSISHEKYPSCLKLARIILIHKNNDAIVCKRFQKRRRKSIVVTIMSDHTIAFDLMRLVFVDLLTYGSFLSLWIVKSESKLMICCLINILQKQVQLSNCVGNIQYYYLCQAGFEIFGILWKSSNIKKITYSLQTESLCLFW